ncbi:MAG: hypothetical protein N2322_04875, partial [Terrimicrobiaceae bacterium]|nr:hypothetical protein [Terrimicrobiaceae bacterium]
MNPKDFTAWLDDTASPRQCRAVERQLGQAASTEKENWRRIRGLLREHLRAPALEHPSFINARVAEA